MTSIENCDNKLMNRLGVMNMTQKAQGEALQNFQEIKMKDLSAKIKNMNSHLDNDLIWRKEFDEMG